MSKAGLTHSEMLHAQPVNKVFWLHRDEVHPNPYNPNHQAPTEYKLLKQSILEDGWTQPLVVRPDYEIVEGEHRWKLSADPEIYALTDGYIPVVIMRPADRAHQIMSTIRHNRARGVHGVMPMAEIVRELKDQHGLTDEQIQCRLGMEDEEVERLYDQGGMVIRGSGEKFGPGWKPIKGSGRIGSGIEDEVSGVMKQEEIAK